MYKQSPSRNHRSKGFKVKHVLQICLLLAVCLWLIYQVRHSHEKRREFDAKDGKIVNSVLTDAEVLKLGRKDLPRTTEIDTGGQKLGEDDEEKEAEDEEESKHEGEEIKLEDEPETEAGKIGDAEDERGGGDDEMDEIDTEKTDPERAHVDESLDEDQEREDNEGNAEENEAEIEEKENPEKEDHSEGEENAVSEKDDQFESEENEDVEKGTALEDRVHDGDATDTHEAREELYKADDASSEVAHDFQTIIPDTENVTMGHANKMFGNASFRQENGTNSNDPENIVQPTEKHVDGISNEKKLYEVNLTKSDDGPLENSSSATLPSSQPEIRNNSAAVDGENPALSNETQMVSKADLSQNATVKGSTGEKDQSLSSNILNDHNNSKQAADDNELSLLSADPNKTVSADSTTVESLSSNNSIVASFQKTNETNAAEIVKDSSLANESQGKKLEDSEAALSDEISSSQSYEEGTDAIQHDPIDVSDTSITEEEEESKTDLDTLPEIRNEIQNPDKTMAEE